MKPIAVVTTIASLEEAQAMALALVERKLAACAQISKIESFYAFIVKSTPGYRAAKVAPFRSRFGNRKGFSTGIHCFPIG